MSSVHGSFVYRRKNGLTKSGTSLIRHDQLLTPFPAPLPTLEDGGGGGRG